MTSQEQDRKASWDGFVRAWLADVDAIEPDVVSVRPVARPAGLVLSSDRELRQRVQLEFTASGFRMVTASDLLQGLQKARSQYWNLILVDESMLTSMDLPTRSELMACGAVLAIQAK